MAKLKRGRLNGVYGIQPFTAAQLLAFADQWESQIQDPQNHDDPKWLRKWADNVRRLAAQKEKARAHKERQR